MKRFAQIALVVVASIAICAAQGDKPDDLFAKARTTYEQQGAKSALEQFEAALKAYRAAGDRRGEAIAIGWVGNCYKHLGDTDRALAMLESSLAIKRELNDKIEQAKTLNNIGLLYWETGRFKEAAQSYKSAGQLADGANNFQIESAILNNLGLAESNLGSFQQALEDYQQALTLARKAGFDRGQSDALGNIGGWYLDLGRYPEALKAYADSTAVAERTGLRPSVMQNVGNTGLIYTALGRVPEALAAFDRAAALASEEGLKREEADWHKGKASALAQVGNYDAALEELRTASRMYREIAAARQEVEVENDLGDLYLAIGDVPSAGKQYEMAYSAAENIGYAQGVQVAAIGLAEIQRHQGQLDKTRSLWDAILRRARGAGDDATAATVLLQIAAVEREQKQFTLARKNADDAEQSAHRIGSPLLECRAIGEKGEILLASAKPAPALDQFRRASVLVKELADSELHWHLAFGEGRAEEALGRYEAAIKAYRAAVEQIESVRDQLREERFRSGYLQSRYDVYIALVRLLIRLHRFDQAFSYSERLRARSYVDTLVPDTTEGGRELAELRARIRRLESAILAEQSRKAAPQRSAGDEYSQELTKAQARYQELIDDLRSHAPAWSAERGLAVSSPEQVRSALPENAALLEYVVGPRATSLICMTRRATFGTAIAVSGANLAAKIELLRDLISQVDRDDWRGPAASLYAQLIAPAVNAGWLKDVTRLYIVPHGVLHYVPFAALLDGKSADAKLLVQQYSLKNLPSASLLLAHSGRGDSTAKLLSVAPARARLRYATQEAESVAELNPASSLALLGTAATKERLTRVAGSYDILHFATHGYFNRQNPMFSGIQLQPEGSDDGMLRVYEILGMQLHARLVTLSACETALGSGFFSDLPPGDEFVGLTRAFLAAGGGSVMAALWEVNDRSTVDFMLDFYRHGGMEDSSLALASVQRGMAAKGPYRHPYYWAAFVLNGVGK